MAMPIHASHLFVPATARTTVRAMGAVAVPAAAIPPAQRPTVKLGAVRQPAPTVHEVIEDEDPTLVFDRAVIMSLLDRCEHDDA